MLSARSGENMAGVLERWGLGPNSQVHAAMPPHLLVALVMTESTCPLGRLGSRYAEFEDGRILCLRGSGCPYQKSPGVAFNLLTVRECAPLML